MAPSRDWEDPQNMISVDDALAHILTHVRPLDAVEVPLLSALGLVLTEDVEANEDVPPFQNSAMDGFALRAADTAGALPDRPVHFEVVETVAAGTLGRQRIETGQAARIMTGAPLPSGADTVVRFEETDESDQVSFQGMKTVGIRRELKPHDNVRDSGEDLRQGALALGKGTRVRPGEIGVLAALNRGHVSVHRRPRVAILATGDEVVDIGSSLEPGQIRNSNSYMVAAAVQRCGGDAQLLGVARDTRTELQSKLHGASAPDFLVSSGGVSHGDYDMVKDVLQREGQIDIWQVRMKPGKPLAFGMLGDVPLLGLPGNPAAALVSFEQFGRPAILRMLGREDVRIPEAEATLAERIPNRGGRRHFVRGIVEQTSNGLTARTTGIHGSAMLSAVVKSNCFIVIPEDCDLAEAGQRVTVQLFDRDSQFA